MSVQLLDKTRKINKLLHNNNSSKVIFNDFCSVLSQVLACNVIVFSRKGKLLGIGREDNTPVLTELIPDQLGEMADPLFNERLLGILSTKENVNLETLGFDMAHLPHYQATIVPIDIAGERFGTLFLYRLDTPYDIDDIILCEYGATVIGLEMLRSDSEEHEEEFRKTQVVKSAVSTLSYSEMEAVVSIFDELHGKEGVLVASKVADRMGITRSVIVNALRKLESAGVIESRSSGMKGTYLKVKNDVLFEEIEELRRKVEKVN